MGSKRDKFERLSALALGVLPAALFVAASLRVFAGAPSARPSDILHHKIPHLRFNGTGIEDALTQLGGTVGRKMVIDHGAWDADGIDPTTPVTLDLHDIELEAAFDRMMVGVHRDYYLVPAGKELHVKAYTSLPSVVRAYDVSDLCQRLEGTPASVPPEFSLNSTSNNQMQNPQRGGAVLRAPPSPLEVVDELTRLITDEIMPEIWKDNGGAELSGTVGKQIIVSAKVPVHRYIEDWLRHLRESIDVEVCK